MNALMQDFPLTLHHIVWRMEKLFARKEIVTNREHGLHRYTYGDLAARARPRPSDVAGAPGRLRRAASGVPRRALGGGDPGASVGVFHEVVDPRRDSLHRRGAED